MALNGSIGWSSGGSYNSFGVYVTWSAKQNIAGNYSDVTASVSVRSTNSGSWFQRDTDIWLSIDGNSDHKIFGNLLLNPNSTASNVYTRTVRVPHDPNGRKIFALSASMSNGTVGTVSVSGSGDLTGIPRAYDFNVARTSVDMDSAVTVLVVDNGSGFSAKVYIAFGNKKILMNGSPPIGSNFTITPKISDFADQISNNTSGVGSYVVETWNGGTKIGETKKSLQLNLPTNVVPTISNIAYADTNNTVTNITGSNQILVQNKSVLQLTTIANGIYGSIIKEYNVSIAGLSFTSTSNVQTIDLSQYTIGTGSIVATITVTDSRGRKASSDVTLNVQAYSPPMLKNFKVTRNMDLNTTINIVKTVAVSSIKDGTTEKNTYTIVTKYKKTVDTAWITAKTETNTSANFALTGMAIESSYDVQVTITDKLSASVTVQSNVPSIFMIMSWSATTVGIGKAAEQGVLDIAGKLSDIYVGGISLLDLHYPVGEIKTTTNSQNPSATIGGTWERYGNGRVPVGVDESDDVMSSAGKTGGSINPLTSHNHDYSGTTGGASIVEGNTTGADVKFQGAASGSGLKSKVHTHSYSGTTTTSGDNTNHNNWQPFITIYMWRRTA